MSNTIVITNREPQEISISGGGEVYGITTVYVNGIDVTDGNVAYVVVPTKTSELQNDSGFITQETDPTVPYYIKQITQADISNWNNKQASLVSGVNIKTINGNSILGSGNMNIQTSYTAGDGIEITNQNVINNTITSYNDLEDLPTIPSYTSQLVNDSNYVVSSQLSNVAYSGSYTDLSNTPEIPAFTSELTNDGENGEDPFITNKTNNLENYYNKEFMWNMLPKLTDSDTNINLTPTVLNAPMYLSLNPSELTQDGTPTPSSPQDIHTISGSNTIKINNKNFFNIENGEQGAIDSSGNYVANPWNWRAVNYITVKPSTTYTFSIDRTNITQSNYLRIYEYDSSKTFLSPRKESANRSDITFTTGATTEYIKYVIYIDNTTMTKSLVESLKPQIELGESRTTYTPYVSQEQEVDLDTLEYCKIGTYEDIIFKNTSASPYYDENLDEGEWYIKKNIGKVVLDGSENWGSTTLPNDKGYRFFLSEYSNKVLKPSSNSTIGVIMSSILSAKSANSTYLGNDGISIDTNGSILIYYSGFSSYIVEQFKTWLGSNNVTLYYVLDTPTYTKITGTLASQLDEVYNNLTSFDEQTNISQVNNDLPFVINATTLKSLINI